MIDLKEYGRRVKAAREQNKFTQQQVAENFGVSKEAISRIEQGDNKSINRDFLKKFSGLFHCSEDYLLGKSEDLKKSAKNRTIPIYLDQQKEMKDEVIRMIIKNPEFVRACIECDKRLSFRDINRLLEIMRIFLE